MKAVAEHSVSTAQGARPTLAARKPGLSLAGREALVGYVLILPSFVGFVAFMVVPMVSSLAISLVDWDLLSTPQFNGLGNYAQLLQDDLFRQVVLNTLFYVVGLVPLNIVLSVGLALWLNSKLRGLPFYRVGYFLPVVTVTVAVALIWKWMYAPGTGLINIALNGFGLPAPNWLGDPHWSMPGLIIMSVWKGFGYNMVVFLAGLQGIPVQLYEAATIDGANGWQRFWRITLPLLSPAIFFGVVMTVISSFQVFDQAYIMTAGGPANSTNTIVMYIYQNGFQFFKMGYASAIAWVLFAAIFVFTVLQMKLQSRWVNYD